MSRTIGSRAEFAAASSQVAIDRRPLGSQGGELRRRFLGLSFAEEGLRLGEIGRVPPRLVHAPALVEPPAGDARQRQNGCADDPGAELSPKLLKPVLPDAFFDFFENVAHLILASALRAGRAPAGDGAGAV
jgi:hypothetical protein